MAQKKQVLRKLLSNVSCDIGLVHVAPGSRDTIGRVIYFVNTSMTDALDKVFSNRSSAI